MSSSLLSSVDALHTKTVHDWRVVQKKLEPLSAKLDAHRRALIASIETGTQVVEAFDALLGVVESSANASTTSSSTTLPLASFNDDAVEQLIALGQFTKQAEIRRQQLIVTLSENLSSPLKSALDEPNRAFESFEKQCQLSNKAQEQHETKLQKAAKAAAGKSPADLKDALAAVSEAVVAAEQTRTAQLRELLAMQRRRYCEFLSQWHHVVEALRSQAATTNEYLLAHGRDLKALATAASAPAPLPEFRVVRDRTLIPLTNTDATRDLPPGVVCAVRALWDCDADEDGDLAFRRGDTIYVLAKDNDSGWYTGTLQGRTGIFPACWVVETTPPTSANQQQHQQTTQEFEQQQQ
jgi:hypothetical protein